MARADARWRASLPRPPCTLSARLTRSPPDTLAGAHSQHRARAITAWVVSNDLHTSAARSPANTDIGGAARARAARPERYVMRTWPSYRTRAEYTAPQPAPRFGHGPSRLLQPQERGSSRRHAKPRLSQPPRRPLARRWRSLPASRRRAALAHRRPRRRAPSRCRRRTQKVCHLFVAAASGLRPRPQRASRDPDFAYQGRRRTPRLPECHLKWG